MGRMNKLRVLRLEQKYTLGQVAAHLGVSSRRLSDYEQGRRKPTIQRMHRWLQFLGVRPEDTLAELYASDDFYDRWADPTADEVQVDEGESWASIQRSYSSLMRQLEPLPELPRYFRRAVRVDSALELLAWCQLLKAGAVALFASPLRLGYSGNALLTGAGRGLHLQAKACLQWSVGEHEIIVFPQITLCLDAVPVRVDALVMVRFRGLRRWVVVEIDGPHHSSGSWDKERDARIAVPVLRFAAEEVRSLRWPERLLHVLSTVPGIGSRAA